MITNTAWQNTPDGSLTINATASVPEPSSVVLLALGAAGLAALRKRRMA